MKKTVMISGAGGSLFPYLSNLLYKKYNLVLIDSNPYISKLISNIVCIQVPKVTDPAYSVALKKAASAHKIDVFIPLIDEEILIANKVFKNSSVQVISPTAAFSKLCLDKYALMKRLDEVGISSVVTHSFKEFEAQSATFPIFIKPITGRGSRGAQVIQSKKQLAAYFELSGYKKNEVMIQENIQGTEYTISVAVNAHNKVLAIVPKKVIEKKGITQHAYTEKNQKLIALCENIVETFKPGGPFNVQLIVENNIAKIIEINPRFSTTSILTCEAGIDEFSLCIEEWENPEALHQENFTEGLHIYRRWESCFFQ